MLSLKFAGIVAKLFGSYNVQVERSLVCFSFNKWEKEIKKMAERPLRKRRPNRLPSLQIGECEFDKCLRG
jgi:hypothetical protein